MRLARQDKTTYLNVTTQAAARKVSPQSITEVYNTGSTKSWKAAARHRAQNFVNSAAALFRNKVSGHSLSSPILPSLTK